MSTHNTNHGTSWPGRIMFELGPYWPQAEDTIFYTNGYETIQTENWRSLDVSNKDLLGGQQFLGINNENKKKKTIWSLQHHKQHYICRVEEEYACDLNPASGRVQFTCC